MKYIMCQPSILKYKWELEVSLTNLIKTHGINPEDIILLFSKHDDSIASSLENKYGVITYTYRDNREDKSYIPSIGPYLWWNFLKDNPEMQNETFFYMDSDVIFREVPNFSKLRYSEFNWVGSDCSGYLDYDYIMQCSHGEEVLSSMCDIVGISVAAVKDIGKNCIGAQRIIVKPKIDYWEKVYYDSNKLWHYLEGIDSNIQKWTVSMWSELWNLPLFLIKPIVSEELAFSWATDDIELWYRYKIYHNAGVTGEDSFLFFKGDYLERTPYGDVTTKSYNKDKCTIKYVEAIRNVGEV